MNINPETFYICCLLVSEYHINIIHRCMALFVFKYSPIDKWDSVPQTNKHLYWKFSLDSWQYVKI